MVLACILAPFQLCFGVNCGVPCVEDRNAESDDPYSTFGGSTASNTSLFGADFGAEFALFSRTSLGTRPGVVFRASGRSWATLGRLMGHYWVPLGAFGLHLGALRTLLSSPWSPLGRSWAALGPSSAALGHPRGSGRVHSSIWVIFWDTPESILASFWVLLHRTYL